MLAQQGPNDLQMLKKHAGTWAVDCARPDGARLGVDAGPPLERQFGKAALAGKFRRCPTG